ncbi:MAG: hypothetical protein Q8O53_03630, partial [Candidatus Moranbacteria bacterium]|nr:hypothetical protein [Candidatus Moranbacteria bacterium]
MSLPWKTTWTILCVIVVLGAGLRLYNLGKNSFVADEFLDINSSYGYFQSGTWKAWDFNYGKLAEMNINDARDERAFIYKGQVAALFYILPPTEGNARLVSVFWGIFSTVLMFWTGYFYTRKKTIGLIAAFLFALSISAIIFDRRLRMYAMFLPVFLALATALFAVFEREYRGTVLWLRQAWERFGINLSYTPLLLVLAGINALVHGLSLILIPIFGAYVLWMAVVVWRKEKTWKNKYAVAVGLGILAVVVALVFFPKLVRLGLGGLVFFDNHYSYFGYVLRDFAHPILGLLMIGWGSYVLGKKLGQPKEALWLTLATVVPLAMAIWFWRRNAGPQYIFFAQSFLLLLTATGVYGVVRLLREYVPVTGKQGAWTVLILAGLLLPNYSYFLEENNTYHETSSGGNPNYRKVFEYFKKNKVDGEVLITRNFRNYYFSGAKVPVYDFGGEL